MKDKLTKAYWTAWRLPEVYSNSGSLIWTSRIIAIVVPLVLIAVTVITVVPLFGWGVAAILVAFLVLVLVLLTIRIFYEEYATVEEFDVKEARVKEFFHGFPSYTDIPLIEYEKDEWVSYGHVESQLFLDTIQTIIYKVTEDPALADSYLGLENSVGHLYATFRNPKEGHWDEGLELCKPSAEHCFPITRVVKKD